MGVEWLEDPYADAYSLHELPPDRWENFLLYTIGGQFRGLEDSAIRCLQHLRDAQELNAWVALNLPDFDALLARLRLTPEEWHWLQLAEPILTDTDTVQEGIDKGRKLNPHGGNRNPTGKNQHTKKEDEGEGGQPDKKEKCQVDLNYGNEKAYRLEQLRRDAKDNPLAAKAVAMYDAGEISTAAAAMRVARGEPAKPPRKKASIVERMRRLWAEANEEDRAEFLAWIRNK